MFERFTLTLFLCDNYCTLIPNPFKFYLNMPEKACYGLILDTFQKKNQTCSFFLFLFCCNPEFGYDVCNRSNSFAYAYWCVTSCCDQMCMLFCSLLMSSCDTDGPGYFGDQHFLPERSPSCIESRRAADGVPAEPSSLDCHGLN